MPVEQLHFQIALEFADLLSDSPWVKFASSAASLKLRARPVISNIRNAFRFGWRNRASQDSRLSTVSRDEQ